MNIRRIPGLPVVHQPADVPQSTAIVIRWTGAGIVAACIGMASIGGTAGFFAALFTVGAFAVVGHRRSEALSDSDRWQARDASRRNV